MHIKDILSTEDNHNRIKLRLADKIKIIRFCNDNKTDIVKKFINKDISAKILFDDDTDNYYVDKKWEMLYDSIVSKVFNPYKNKECAIIFSEIEPIKFNPVGHTILIIFDVKHKLFIYYDSKGNNRVTKHFFEKINPQKIFDGFKAYLNRWWLNIDYNNCTNCADLSNCDTCDSSRAECKEYCEKLQFINLIQHIDTKSRDFGSGPQNLDLYCTIYCIYTAILYVHNIVNNEENNLIIDGDIQKTRTNLYKLFKFLNVSKISKFMKVLNAKFNINGEQQIPDGYKNNISNNVKLYDKRINNDVNNDNNDNDNNDADAAVNNIENSNIPKKNERKKTISRKLSNFFGKISKKISRKNSHNITVVN